MNPLVESKSECSGDAGEMPSLTSEQTEERLKEALQHCATRADEYQLPIPLKRVDSGPRLHHIQVSYNSAYFSLALQRSKTKFWGLSNSVPRSGVACETRAHLGCVRQLHFPRSDCADRLGLRSGV